MSSEQPCGAHSFFSIHETSEDEGAMGVSILLHGLVNKVYTNCNVCHTVVIKAMGPVPTRWIKIKFLEPEINYTCKHVNSVLYAQKTRLNLLVLAMHVIGRTLNTRQTFF